MPQNDVWTLNRSAIFSREILIVHTLRKYEIINRDRKVKKKSNQITKSDNSLNNRQACELFLESLPLIKRIMY